MRDVFEDKIFIWVIASVARAGLRGSDFDRTVSARNPRSSERELFGAGEVRKAERKSN